MAFTRHLVQVEKLFEPKPEPDKDWQDRAGCKDHMELFLIDTDQKQIAYQRRLEAKTQGICLTCPVRIHCLWHALENNEKFYMWGGATPDQRKALRQKLRMREDEEVAS